MRFRIPSDGISTIQPNDNVIGFSVRDAFNCPFMLNRETRDTSQRRGPWKFVRL